MIIKECKLRNVLNCEASKNIIEVAKELKIDAEVEYETDVSKMIEMGVMTSPVLAIDGKPVLSGGGKSEEEIKRAIQDNSKEEKPAAGGCSCCGGC